MSYTGALEATASFTSPLEPTGLYNVKHRAVGPPRLQTLPTFPADHCADDKLVQHTFGSELQSKAVQIAADNGVHVRADLANRSHSRFGDQTIAVLMVADDWDAESSPAVWQSIVEQVKCYVDGRVKETPGMESWTFSWI